MKEEKGVAVVTYKKPGRTPRYLVLKRKKNWEGWELPKGHLEKEDYEETVRIELEEEAGIEDIVELEETDKVIEWTYKRDGEEFRKKYRLFKVKVPDKTYCDVSENPCDEHETGMFLCFEDAKSLITHDNMVEALEYADETVSD